jgi:sirohydrochlorin cobaltochelatase
VAIGLPQNVGGQEAPVFTHDALLLIGHGSTVLPGAARPLLAHAEVIRASQRFREVAVCMMLGEPEAASVVRALTSQVVHVVPFFLEDGYFTRIAIPDLLLPFGSASRVIRFCPHIGSHGGIAEVIEDRLLRHCAMFGIDPKSLSVLLIGHGSERNPGRARSLRRHVAALETNGRFGWVRIAYLEEAPSVADALSSARVHVVATVGYLANDGVHATQDLPGLIAAERDQRSTHWPPIHDLGSIGSDEAMPRLIMDQVTPA